MSMVRTFTILHSILNERVAENKKTVRDGREGLPRWHGDIEAALRRNTRAFLRIEPLRRKPLFEKLRTSYGARCGLSDLDHANAAVLSAMAVMAASKTHASI